MHFFLKLFLWLIAVNNLATAARAQYSNVWLPLGIDFNSFPPSESTSLPGLENRLRDVFAPNAFHHIRGEAFSTVCDKNGNYLFYTNGTIVLNRQLEIMPNGYDIVDTSPAYPNPIFSTHHGTLIVPLINEDSLFYIFSLGGSSSGADMSISKKLFYSVVDLRLENGLGDVALGRKHIFLGEPYAEGMIAVPGNHCNVWLVLKSFYSGDYHAFEITSDGIDTNAVISVDPRGLSSHIVSFNYSEEVYKFLIATDQNSALWKFDPNTGVLSEPIKLIGRDRPFGFNGFENIAFDSSGRYIFYRDRVDGDVGYRADVSIHHPDSIQDRREVLPFLPDGFILGPDDKLYCVNRERDFSSDCGYIPNPTDSIHNLEYIPLPSLKVGLGSIFDRTNKPIVKVSAKDHVYSDAKLIENTSCFGSASTTLMINQESPWDIEWSTGDTTASIQVGRPGIYSVRYALSPCEWHADTFTVRYLNGVLPQIQIQNACKGANNGKAWAGTFPGDTVVYHYLWKNSQQDTLSFSDTLFDVSSGNYTLLISIDSCDTTLSFFIPEQDYQVAFASSDTLICLGDTLQFVNTSDTHYTAFYWDFGNGDTLYEFEPVLYRYERSGAYQVMLRGTGAICEDTVYQSIIVDQPPVPDFAVEPKEVCVGQPVYFYPSTDSTTVQLAWEMDEQLRVERRSLAHYQHGFASHGIFPVSLSIQSRACPDTSYTDTIVVYPLPEVDLGVDSGICLNGQPVYLKNLREAPLIPYRQVWSTGDTTEVLKVVHPGIYTLSVTTGQIGCTTTESIEITKDCYIDIPSAFTPNGDGHNDYFLPQQLLSESLSHFKMQVFNRWGQQVFETNRLDGRGWNGRLNDKLQPMGVYLYRIETDFSNGRQEIYEGNVTLIR